MKILIVTQVVDVGDPDLGFFVRWIEEFAKHVEHIEVICLKMGRSDLPKNVWVHSLGKENSPPRGARRVTYAFRFLSLVWRLRSDYDAVFVHMNPEYVVLAGPLWRVLGKKVMLWYTHKSVDLKLRIAVFFANKVFTASSESFRLASEKVRVVGHGIDLAQFDTPRAPRAAILRLLTIGRLAPSKRVLDMFDLLDELTKRGIPFSFTIAGVPATLADEQYEKKVRATAFSKTYADKVIFLGAVAHDEIPALLASNDVFINLSTTGSMDKAVLEALIAGTPAVTTNEAFRDLLAPSGLFVTTDTPIARADAVVRASTFDMSELTAEARERFALPRLITTICASLAA